MTITPVGLFRAISLTFAVGALLAGTVLFPLVRRFVRAWLRMAERMAGPGGNPPAVVTQALANDAIVRGWQLLCALIAFGVWWYLGTAAGAAFVAGAFRPR